MCPQQLFYWQSKLLLDHWGGPQNISFQFLTFVLTASISNLSQAISACSNCVCLSYWKRFNFQIEILCLRLDFLHSPLCACALNHDTIEEFQEFKLYTWLNRASTIVLLCLWHLGSEKLNGPLYMYGSNLLHFLVEIRRQWSIWEINHR